LESLCGEVSNHSKLKRPNHGANSESVAFANSRRDGGEALHDLLQGVDGSSDHARQQGKSCE
jgi:hypothetical protein